VTTITLDTGIVEVAGTNLNADLLEGEGGSCSWWRSPPARASWPRIEINSYCKGPTSAVHYLPKSLLPFDFPRKIRLMVAARAIGALRASRPVSDSAALRRAAPCSATQPATASARFAHGRRQHPAQDRDRNAAGPFRELPVGGPGLGHGGDETLAFERRAGTGARRGG
jgi:hypothetical protein